VRIFYDRFLERYFADPLCGESVPTFTATAIELLSLAWLPNGLTEPTIRGVDAF
jgi:hypothetical protein